MHCHQIASSVCRVKAAITFLNLRCQSTKVSNTRGKGISVTKSSKHLQTEFVWFIIYKLSRKEERFIVQDEIVKDTLIRRRRTGSV